MPELTTIAKVLLLLGVASSGAAEGTLAYYHDTNIRNVCQYRTANGWNDLDCSFPCQIASINNHVGEYWLVALPNCNGKTVYKVCLVVDCGNGYHLDTLKARGEVVEISGRLARQCGYQDYIEGTQIWRLEEPSKTLSSHLFRIR